MIFRLMSIILIAGVAQAAEPISQKILDKIQPQLLSKAGKKKAGKPLPALVVLREEANLDSVKKEFSNRGEQVQFVYDSLRKVALKSQKGLLRFLKSKKASYQRFYIVNMVAIDDVDTDLLYKIAEREDVRTILDNPDIKNSLPQSAGIPSPGGRVAGANLVSVGAPQVWQDFKIAGQGIVVAGQDTGVQFDHPALVKQYRGTKASGGFDHSYSWHDSIKKQSGRANPCGYNTTAPCDDDQHGTHTMGSMVGNDGGQNQTGVAPSAQWIACRNMDQGVGNPRTYLECFEFFLAPYPQGKDPLKDGNPKMAPHVINNSWGCPTSEGCKGDEFLGAITALEKAGIMVVVSAGNAGPGCSTINDAPAHYTDLTLSIGALDHRTGTIASFSSRGPSKYDKGVGPDTSAPGVNIRSTVPGNKYEEAGWSGTSMAGPHVVGEVALIWSSNPNYIGRIKETTELIRKTSTPKTTTQTCGNIAGTEIPNNTYGYGMINVYEAVKKAKSR